jgi:hypothetical protein
VPVPASDVYLLGRASVPHAAPQFNARRTAARRLMMPAAIAQQRPPAIDITAGSAANYGEHKKGAHDMRHAASDALILSSLLAAAVPSIGQNAPRAPGPCEQIVAACKSAGFIDGDYRTGNGLHVDCIDPIMRGGGQPPKAKLPLPQVNPALVAACRQKHPKFGEPKGESPPPPKS